MRYGLEGLVALAGEVELEMRGNADIRAAGMAVIKRTLAELLADQVVEKRRLKSAAKLADVLAEQPSMAGME